MTAPRPQQDNSQAQQDGKPDARAGQRENKPVEKQAATDSTSADPEQGVNPTARPDRHAHSIESSDADGSERASETEMPRE